MIKIRINDNDLNLENHDYINLMSNFFDGFTQVLSEEFGFLVFAPFFILDNIFLTGFSNFNEMTRSLTSYLNHPNFEILNQRQNQIYLTVTEALSLYRSTIKEKMRIESELIEQDEELFNETLKIIAILKEISNYGQEYLEEIIDFLTKSGVLEKDQQDRFGKNIISFSKFSNTMEIILSKKNLKEAVIYIGEIKGEII